MAEIDWANVYQEAIIEGMKTTLQLFRPYYKYLLIILFIRFFLYIYKRQSQRKIRNQIQALANEEIEITPKEFFKIRNKGYGGRGNPLYANKFHFTGVYILHNQTKDLYYVGQSKKVFNRINSHFTGKGNGDIYADYKANDRFTIRTIALNGSNYDSLDDLERHAIESYQAYKKGYNRIRGNR